MFKILGYCREHHVHGAELRSHGVRQQLLQRVRLLEDSIPTPIHALQTHAPERCQPQHFGCVICEWGIN